MYDIMVISRLKLITQIYVWSINKEWSDYTVVHSRINILFNMLPKHWPFQKGNRQWAEKKIPVLALTQTSSCKARGLTQNSEYKRFFFIGSLQTYSLAFGVCKGLGAWADKKLLML